VLLILNCNFKNTSFIQFFLPNRMNQRVHADNSKATEINEIKLKQLEKTNNLINKSADHDLAGSTGSNIMEQCQQ
jgi:hypothetical protein